MKKLLVALLLTLSSTSAMGAQPTVNPDSHDRPSPVIVKPKPTIVKISLHAQPTVNQGSDGGPSPVFVKFYVLKSIAEFESADFFSIFNSEQKTLGGELLDSQTFYLHPGEKLEVDKPLQPNARYIAVIAAFRDLEHSQWRAVLAIPHKEKISHVLIQVNASKILIDTERDCFLCIRMPSLLGSSPEITQPDIGIK